MIVFNNGHAELLTKPGEVSLTITQDHPVGWERDDDWNAGTRQNYAANHGEPEPVTVTVTMGPGEAGYLIGALISCAVRAREGTLCPVCHLSFIGDDRAYPRVDAFIAVCSRDCAAELEHRDRAYREHVAGRTKERRPAPRERAGRRRRSVGSS
jgi:hypothetical protein